MGCFPSRPLPPPGLTLLLFFKDFILFLEEKGRERKGDKHQCVVTSHTSPTGDPSICPDWESNQRPFGSQAGIQSTEPHQPGLINTVFLSTLNLLLVHQTLELPFQACMGTAPGSKSKHHVPRGWWTLSRVMLTHSFQFLFSLLSPFSLKVFILTL